MSVTDSFIISNNTIKNLILIHHNGSFLFAVLPLVHVYPRFRTVREGQDATFRCNVSQGIPEPELRWFHKEKELGTSATLVLRHVKRQTDEGNYTCNATNEAGSSNSTAILNVDGKFRNATCSTERRCDLSNAVTIRPLE